MLRSCLLCLFLGMASCVFAQKTIATTDLPRLVDSVHLLILQRHPSTLREEVRTALERARTQVQSQIQQATTDSLSLSGVTRLLLPLQEATGCGHLLLRPYQDSLGKAAVAMNQFDLSLALLDDGRYVLRRTIPTSRDSIRIGREVRSINGEPVEEVLHNISTFQGLNDRGAHHITRMVYASGPSAQYQKFYGLRDSLQLGLAGPKESVIIYPRQVPYRPNARDTANLADHLRFELHGQRPVGLLAIKSLKSRHYRDGNFYDFIRQSFDSLRTVGADRLVIDLRGNTGGSSSKLSFLARHLMTDRFTFARQTAAGAPDYKPTRPQRQARRHWKRRLRPIKNDDRRFTGEVVVVVDEFTYSAAAMLAHLIQSSGRGTVVGRPTGGSTNLVYSSTGAYAPVRTGPNGELELLVNDVELLQTNDRPGTLVPDRLFPLTLEQLTEGKDPALEFALGNVRR